MSILTIGYLVTKSWSSLKREVTYKPLQTSVKSTVLNPFMMTVEHSSPVSTTVLQNVMCHVGGRCLLIVLGLTVIITLIL